MAITFIGYFHLVVGSLIALRGSLRQAFLFLFVSGLFSGSAALVLSNGGSSVPPIYFALLFVYLRIAAPRGGFMGSVPDSIRANRWLALFALYGVAMAYIGPRLFAGAIDVYPMRMVARDSLFDTLPLEPTPQNVTASIYMIGTLLLGVAAWIASRREDAPHTLVTAILWVSWGHIGFGLLALLARGTPFDAVLDLLRNSTYIQLDDTVGGIVRMRGIFPEASDFAGFGFAYFVASAELWYRSIRSRETGAAALAMAMVLFFSTSSTAYAGLAIYLAFFFVRALLLPRLANSRKVRAVLAAVGGFGVLFAAVIAVAPNLAESILKMLELMTVAKSSSDSGAQRLFWAMQGRDAFLVSHGLGVGPGSFRSSSMVMAVVGSLGVVGIATFLTYLLAVFQPWRRSSWGDAADYRTSVGGALASAALLSLIPAALSSANPHPAPTFAILAGAALALRPSRLGRRDHPGRATYSSEFGKSPFDGQIGATQPRARHYYDSGEPVMTPTAHRTPSTASPGGKSSRNRLP
jgi:hypothetical protein